MDKNIKFQYFAVTQTERAQIKKKDAYPRFGPTSLWDMAVGHAILKETGGEIYTLDQEPFVYNINQILNPDLIAVSDKKLKFNVEERHES